MCTCPTDALCPTGTRPGPRPSVRRGDAPVTKRRGPVGPGRADERCAPWKRAARPPATRTPGAGHGPAGVISDLDVGRLLTGAADEVRLGVASDRSGDTQEAPGRERFGSVSICRRRVRNHIFRSVVIAGSPARDGGGDQEASPAPVVGGRGRETPPPVETAQRGSPAPLPPVPISFFTASSAGARGPGTGRHPRRDHRRGGTGAPRRRGAPPRCHLQPRSQYERW